MERQRLLSLEREDLVLRGCEVSKDKVQMQLQNAASQLRFRAMSRFGTKETGKCEEDMEGIRLLGTLEAD